MEPSANKDLIGNLDAAAREMLICVGESKERRSYADSRSVIMATLSRKDPYCSAPTVVNLTLEERGERHDQGGRIEVEASPTDSGWVKIYLSKRGACSPGFAGLLSRLMPQEQCGAYAASEINGREFAEAVRRMKDFFLGLPANGGNA